MLCSLPLGEEEGGGGHFLCLLQPQISDGDGCRVVYLPVSPLEVEV
jgi:hypothetical protein